VAVKFDDIKGDFLELKGFVLSDLEIITSAPRGGNYAATLLITTACEALGTVRYGKKDGGVDFSGITYCLRSGALLLSRFMTL